MTASSPQEFKARVQKSLRRGVSLSTLAGVLHKLQVVAADDHSSAKDLAKVIRSDSVLTARVLSQVNSAAYGLERRISSVDEAVVILGYGRLRAITTGVLAADVACSDGQCRAMDRQALWRHSLATAMASGFLQSRYLTQRPATDLFTAGLLCNMGRVILDQWFGPECEQIHRAAMAKGGLLLDAEREVLGVTHAEIGFWAAEAWHFDEALAQVIRHHHGPVTNRGADIVNLAYVLSQALRMGSPGEGQITHLLPGVLARLEIDDFVLDGLLRHLAELFRSMDAVFKSLAGA